MQEFLLKVTTRPTYADLYGIDNTVQTLIIPPQVYN